MGIRISSKDPNHSFRIWLPGVLLLLLLLLFLPLLLLVVFFVVIALLIWNLLPGQHQKAWAYTKVVCSIPKIFIAMRGLKIDVESEEAVIKINF